MDKGFNDDELADIMNEIESLEQEFTEEVHAAAQEEEPVAEAPAEEPTMEASAEEPVMEMPAEEPVMEASAEEPVMEMPAEEPVMEMPAEEPVMEMPAEEPVATVTADSEVEPEGLVASMASEEPTMTAPVEVDGKMDEVLSELSEMNVEEVTGGHVEAQDDNVFTLHSEPAATHHEPEQTHTPVHHASRSTHTTGAHSQMSFNVEGDMKLDLSFNISGKFVHLNITENGFEIELDGGMKFTIPVDEHQQNKKAA